MKNPLTPAGIKPATFRFVAQHLNYCAAAVPPNYVYRNTETIFMALRPYSESWPPLTGLRDVTQTHHAR